jgi:hypothetical protein
MGRGARITRLEYRATDLEGQAKIVARALSGMRVRVDKLEAKTGGTPLPAGMGGSQVVVSSTISGDRIFGPFLGVTDASEWGQRVLGMSTSWKVVELLDPLDAEMGSTEGG